MSDYYRPNPDPSAKPPNAFQGGSAGPTGPAGRAVPGRPPAPMGASPGRPIGPAGPGVPVGPGAPVSPGAPAGGYGDASGSAPVRGSVGRASVVGAARPKPEAGATGPGRKKKKKKMSTRRRRVYAALIMVCLMMLGAITVAGSWFFESVPPPEDLAFGESTTFTYKDGSTQVAGYGEYTRKLVDDFEELPDQVIWSLLALEDKDFFEHEGVDYKGTMRALVNNITGGDTQGASTISQQYAGMVSAIRDDISYGRKAKEAVMAMKLEQQYSKEEILLHYLNLNFYGRGTYGIEAAAQTWFGVGLEELTWGQGMMLVMQVKAGDGSFDPRIAAEGSTAPVDRWTHGMETLLTLTDDLNDEQLAAVQAELDAGMPETLDALKNPGSWGHDTPTGFITNPTDGYVWDELESRYGLTQNDFYGKDENTGGYTVQLTIDQEIQNVAYETASRGDLKRQKDGDNYVDDNGEVVTERAEAAEYVNDDGFFEFENDNEEAALYEYNPSMADAVVAVEPGTGRVLGYYGGDNGLGIDKAGMENPHPPSSTFKMVTAATAIKEGASIESWWNSDSPREFEGRETPVSNAGRTENTDMTLTDAVRNSRNTPMYAIAEKWGATTILETAIEMGLRSMQNTGNGDIYRFYIESDGTITYSVHNTVELEDGSFVTDVNGNIDPLASVNGYDDNENPVRTPLDLEDPRSPFDFEIGFGQFPTSVLDMASVYATLANDGTYNETHFVEAVYDRDGNKVEPVRGLEETPALDVDIARDLQWVGSEIDGDGGAIDRPYTGKTGTWEATAEGYDDANAHTWYIGAIPQLSIATWVGNATAESAPLLNKEGGTDNLFGGTLSYPVWKQFMEGAIEVKDYESEGWEPVTIHPGSAIVDDIVNEDGTIDADSPYCALNAGDSRCGNQNHGGGGGGNNGEECDAMSEWLGLCEPGGGGGGGGNGNGNGNGGGDDDD
ncbi:transglycosylase domain-containing protein [Glycomyces harbinensis]|uniref:Membrane carboxypeptidase (Penicillin-binding protein) n=1 Tax=Glycomyces harbinensis TaxID=58114 RepID=A0A1G6T114_9ACTN|nr:transglycosylase domain-containing protein [Glycomyces harbinensis]SDD22167.1 Membrane carboxypeptidase (penicillin-binding protein) [Glycomyces harbinensis]